MSMILGAISFIAVVYILRYYLLTANLRKAAKEMQRIKQNPDENRILLFSFPSREAERLFLNMNEYILCSRKERILYKKREKKLKAQIENISHDLRTPLTAILGYLEMIDKEELNKENKEAVEVLERKSRSLQGLITNFYDLSRLEMDDYHLILQPLNFVRFTQETMLQYFQEFENHNLSVELNLDKAALTVMADEGAMERIFANMVQNALRYAESYLTVSIKSEDENVLLIFENDTKILTEKDVERLFERFYVKDQSRTRQSTGLGLTISKLLAEAMGGTASASLEKNSLRITYAFPKNIRNCDPVQP